MPLLFLVGCQSKQARLLKETAWYEDSVKWYDSKYPGFKRLKINMPYIWMGKVVKVDYSIKGEISDIYLENGERLKPYSMFSEDIRLWANKKNFNSTIPKAGEYWAFRVNRDLKGTLHIIQAVRLKYDLDMDGVQVFDPLAPKPNFTLIVINHSLVGSPLHLKIKINDKVVVNQKFSKDAVVIQHTLYSFPLHLHKKNNIIEVSGAAYLKESFIFDSKNNKVFLMCVTCPWYKFRKNAIGFRTFSGNLGWR